MIVFSFFSGIHLGIRFLEKSAWVYENITDQTSEAGSYAVSSERGRVGNHSEEIGKYFQRDGGSSVWDIGKPLFGRNDGRILRNLLLSVHEHIQEPWLRTAMTAQILGKAWAALAHIVPGTFLEIPGIDVHQQPVLISYRIDKKFDLWEKIPAFGLIAENREGPPLLIFRGTNVNVSDPDSLPSILSNFHEKGPGWNLFRSSRREIGEWLERSVSLSGKQARVIGYSQGGAVASYCLLFFNTYFGGPEPSVLLDSPGISEELSGYRSGSAIKPDVISYIHEGDPIPKIGEEILGEGYLIRTDKRNFPESHTVLSLFAPRWEVRRINERREKDSCRRKIFSAIRRFFGKKVYGVAKSGCDFFLSAKR